MHYLLTPDEFKRLRGFDDAKEWERQVNIYVRGLMQAFGREVVRLAQVNPYQLDKFSLLEFEKMYREEHPYPALENYLDLKSHEPGFNEDKAID